MKVKCIKDYGAHSFKYVRGMKYLSNCHQGVYFVIYVPGTTTGVLLDPTEFSEHFVNVFNYGK